MKRDDDIRDITDGQPSPYLWDSSGKPEADVQRLEQLLARYKHDAPMRPVAVTSRPRWRVWAWGFAGAASLAVAAVAGYIALLPRVGLPGGDWKVTARDGAPRIAGRAIAGTGILQAGAVLETDSNSRAEVEAGRVGRIELAPNSRFRILNTGERRHQLALDRGKLEAHLWAPPFTFSFATPTATAYDLGCAFILEAGENGEDLVRVTSGWVQFSDYEHHALIPAGAVAISRKGRGPGSPFFEDATPAFREALRRLDFEALDEPTRAAVLATVLHEARRRDVYTLITLVAQLTPAERGQLFDRAAQLYPIPRDVTREGVLQNNELIMDHWRRELGFGDAKRWWVHWPDAFR